MNYANFGKRFLALLIDSMILNVVIVPLIYVGFYDFPVTLFDFLMIFIALGTWFYFGFMESSEKQATLGKMALGIVVTDIYGERISFGRATGRYFAKGLSYMLGAIGFLMAAFTEKRQGLHDMIAGTLVLNGAAVPIAYPASAPAPQPVFQAAALVSPSRYQPVVYGITGEFSGRAIPVDGRGITIGRDSSFCQISFSQNAAGISRRHCTITYQPATRSFILMDIGSSYGTFLESGMKCMQGNPITLMPGAKFYLSERSNMFEVRL